MTTVAPSQGAAAVDLSGQVALVTGASTGLGRRFAEVLAGAGAKVAVCGRRKERLDEVCAGIAQRGGTGIPIVADVTVAEQVVASVSEAENQLGLVNILVNNAGIPDARRAHKLPIELVDQVIATNLRAPWLYSCEVARRLIAAKSPGRIVNISSIGAFHYDAPGAALYSTTKAAVNRLTETLAVEWVTDNINVNAIAPGAIMTEMMEAMIERVGDITPTLPRRRMGQPSHVDSTLLYLVAPASEFVTGTVIRVDDGQRPR